MLSEFFLSSQDKKQSILVAFEKLCGVDPPSIPNEDDISISKLDSFKDSMRYARFDSATHYRSFIESKPNYQELASSKEPPEGTKWEEEKVGIRYDSEPYYKREPPFQYKSEGPSVNFCMFL